MFSTHGIVLAAGGSTRMGRPKALLDLGGRPLLLHHLEALHPFCDDLVVVLGGHAAEVARVVPPGVGIVVNDRWAVTGASESLLLGLAGREDAGQVLVTPVDVPPAPPRVLRALLDRGAPAVPTWRDQPGHPVLVGVGAARTGLPGATLRHVLAAATCVPVDWPDTIRNFNRPRDWMTWITSGAHAG